MTPLPNHNWSFRPNQPYCRNKNLRSIVAKASSADSSEIYRSDRQRHNQGSWWLKAFMFHDVESAFRKKTLLEWMKRRDRKKHFLGCHSKLHLKCFHRFLEGWQRAQKRVRSGEWECNNVKWKQSPEHAITFCPAQPRVTQRLYENKLDTSWLPI